MHRDAALPTFRLDAGISLAQASPWNDHAVTLASPALEVVTDLSQVKAATVAPSATLAQAEQMMIFQGVRLLFVVNEMPFVEGLITSTDLHGDRQLRRVHDAHLRYDDLVVADVMTALAQIDAIDFDALAHASVGKLIATLERFGRNHMLVVQRASAEAPRRVRGIVSRAQIERQLGKPIEITPIASSFSEIERALS
ncbi:CBS domain containing protein [Rubrivivax sp. A210]|uniref:CBS domain-containing protein n=1 Tax=Rubrivivax sp. A210 TaxID=2772301 RepID=UPI00191855C7|nr:CBS domain-containing protein [Rubrivivax sp. A210]CAD5372238.1 CBS domain containing protein [Rubrivivax sp. A210]